VQIYAGRKAASKRQAAKWAQLQIMPPSSARPSHCVHPYARICLCRRIFVTFTFAQHACMCLCVRTLSFGIHGLHPHIVHVHTSIYPPTRHRMTEPGAIPMARAATLLDQCGLLLPHSQSQNFAGVAHLAFV